MEETSKMYELRKDVSTPGAYIRAGERDTRAGWEKRFPGSFLMHGHDKEWFIDLELETHEDEQNLATRTVNEVFAVSGLRSMSYHAAAVRACKLYHERATLGPPNILLDVKLQESMLMPNMANDFFHKLLNGQWHVPKTATGKKSKGGRLMRYVSDDDEYTYQYANFQVPGEGWSSELKTLRDLVERATGEHFNSVLLNLYNDGNDVINWHADKEDQLGPEPTIACLNLGATRKLHFKSIVNKDVVHDYTLSSGDLLVMGPKCQSRWLHAVLAEPEVTGARISLTFRRVYP